MELLSHLACFSKTRMTGTLARVAGWCTGIGYRPAKDYRRGEGFCAVYNALQPYKLVNVMGYHCC